MNLVKKGILIVMVLLLCGCKAKEVNGSDVIGPVVTTNPSQTSYPVETKKPNHNDNQQQETQDKQDEDQFEEKEELPEFEDVGIEFDQQEEESSNEDGLQLEEDNEKDGEFSPWG